MVRFTFTLGLCTVIALSSRAADPVPFDPKPIDDIVTTALQQWGTPGLAIAIVKDGQPVLVKGYGVKQLGKPDAITANTVFPLGSCSKAFTSALIAQLVDEERLSWDDPVKKHLPTFRLKDPNVDALVTLRDLLSHRTGVDSHDYLWYRAPWSLEETVRRISFLPVSFRFRDSYNYSTLMYMAAGLAVMKRMDKPWEDLLRERITTPLGMSHTTFSSPEMVKSTDRALGHERAADGRIVSMSEYELKAPNPAGSIFTTITDMVPWVQMQLADGTFQGKTIISKQNLTETKTPHTIMRKDALIAPVYPDTQQVSYAMGWVVYDYRGQLVIAHGGVLDGFRAQVTLLPSEKIGIVLFNNLHQTKMNIAITNSIIDRLQNLPAKDWNAYYLNVEKTERETKQAAIDREMKQRKPNTKPTATLDLYTAKYYEPAYGEAKITLANGQLAWEWSTFRSSLEHFHDDVFRITEGTFQNHFIEFRVVNGLPTAMRANNTVYGRQP